MKRKILWLGLSFLLVAALVLASCGPAAPGEQEEEEEEEEVGAPQRGGTLNYFKSSFNTDPPGPDLMEGHFQQLAWLYPIQEMPVIGDFEKYGPRGTGECAFQATAFVPEAFLTGQLLESWDVSYDELVWHVRPGIMWQPGYSGIMDARELTAQDIVEDLIYFRSCPAGGRFESYLGDTNIYAEDKYTVVIEITKFDISWIYTFGYEDRALIEPPETRAAGANKWENQVGTGPFMFKEYVVGSHMSYERNPDYWKTTTINGKEYEIPFVDELVCPIIPDESTQLAALRTGQLDYVADVQPRNWATLDEAGLLSAGAAEGTGWRVVLRCNQPPFDDVNVRRALFIGTDIKAFADLQGAGPLPLHWFPLYTGDPGVYTPLEELPEDIQILYEYDPDEAIRLLALAGYPDGLTISLNTQADLRYQDRTSLLVDQWSKIGVEAEIKVDEPVAAKALRDSCEYDAAIFSYTEIGNPTKVVQSAATGGIENFSRWTNERVDELAALIPLELDIAERNRMYKEMGLIFLSEASSIPTDPNMARQYYWPWIKNFYGEWNLQDNPSTYVLAHAWLDLALKADMGY